MSKFKFLLITFLFICLGLTVKAQRGDYYLTTDGRPLVENNYTDINGYPYVFDKWLPGIATTDKGRVFAGELKLKYNVYDDVLMFVYDTGDKPLSFADPIKSFEILTPQPLVFVNGYPAIDKQTPRTYYQAIALGKLSVLKKYGKIIVETKGYSTNMIERRFDDEVVYYTYKDNRIAPLKKTKDAILELTADKHEQIEAYLKSNSINLKKDDDLAKLFNYYNTL